jgi:hypothetical protein
MVVAVLEDDGEKTVSSRRSIKRISWNWANQLQPKSSDVVGKKQVSISAQVESRPPGVHGPVPVPVAVAALASLTLEEKLRSVESLAAKHGYSLTDYTTLRQIKTPNSKQGLPSQSTSKGKDVSPVRGILKPKTNNTLENSSYVANAIVSKRPVRFAHDSSSNATVLGATPDMSFPSASVMKSNMAMVSSGIDGSGRKGRMNSGMIALVRAAGGIGKTSSFAPPAQITRKGKSGATRAVETRTTAGPSSGIRKTAP